MLHHFKRSVIIAASFFILLLLLSLFYVDIFSVRPNVFLVMVIMGALFVEHAVVFLVFLLGVIWWFVFSPFFEIEYLVLFLMGAASFVIWRLFFLHKHLGFALLLTAVFSAVFWIIVFGSSFALSVPFLLELLYNSIIVVLVFIFGLWLERKFS